MPQSHMDHADLYNLLAWHVAMGADEAIADKPIDAFEVTASMSPLVAEPQASKMPARPTERARAANGPTPIVAKPVQLLAGAGAKAAKEAASKAASLEDLHEIMKAFDGGTLKRQAKNTVFAAGDPSAPIMVIGDVPESEDDASGIPFVGPAGQLLDKMLGAIQVGRNSGAYLMHFIPWRPLGKSRPTPDTVAMLQPFVEKHIELAAPKILVLMGGVPASALFASNDSISRLRGRWKDLTFGSHTVPTIALYHPDRLLGQPQQKAAAWQDLLSIKEKLTSL